MKKKIIKINAKLIKQVKYLDDESYKIVNGRWVAQGYTKKDGYFVEVDNLEKRKKWYLKENEYLGIWHDEKDNSRLWIGFSVWIKSKKIAINLGLKLGEKAIWDCAKIDEIRLKCIICDIVLNDHELGKKTCKKCLAKEKKK